MSVKKGLMFIWLLLPALLFAQVDIKVDRSQRAFSKGTYPAYQLEIPQCHLKKTQADWIDYLKKGAKNKPAVVNGETIITGAVNKNVSPAPFNVYSTLLETTDGVRLTAWITLNNDSIYVSTALNDRDVAVEKYLHDFAVMEYKDGVKEELKTENTKLKKLEGELNDLYKDQDKASKKSNEYKRDIERNRDKIKVNDNDQQNKQAQIEQEKQIIEGLKSNPGKQLDEAKKTLKGYESDLKKLVNVKEKLHKEIDKWEADIRAQGRNNTEALSDQRVKNDAIEKQKTVINSVQKKLDGIK